jgi:Ser/Thr protein kinase RdoA (MazF antagonist)
MPNSRYDLSPIIAAYPVDCRPMSIRDVLSNGFSGSQLWKLQTPRGPFCLRCWPPEHPTPVRLRWIHGLLASAFQAGFRRLPLPIPTSDRETFVCHGGRLWQLEPWLPGTAIEAKIFGQLAAAPYIEDALTALAEFHQAICLDAATQLPDSSPPGLQNRRVEVDTLLTGGLERLSDQITANGHVWPEMAQRAGPLLKAVALAAPAIAPSLRKAAARIVPIQPCIRDIHRQHVLFASGKVTGIVDFGAMRPDHVAADIARLVGSLAGDEIDLRRLGIEAYCRVCPMSDQDRRLIQVYNDSEVLLSGTHWLQWIFVNGRQFENRPTVLARFDEILARLVRLIDRQAGQGGLVV